MSDGVPYITYVGSVMRLYNFPLSSSERAIIGCYDNIPYRFYEVHLIEYNKESLEYIPEAIGCACLVDEDELLKEYCFSIPDSYHHKYEYVEKFRRDLKKDKFIFKIYIDFLSDLREYYIKVLDITDLTKSMTTHNFQGKRILYDHYIEVFEKYKEFKESKFSRLLEFGWGCYLEEAIIVIGICVLIVCAIKSLWLGKE